MNKMNIILRKTLEKRTFKNLIKTLWLLLIRSLCNQIEGILHPSISALPLIIQDSQLQSIKNEEVETTLIN